MPTPTRRYTAADLQSFPDDGNRYELIDGELLVTPAPRFHHQLAIRALHRVLEDYLRPHGRDEVFDLVADITFAPDTLVQPDLFVADLTAARQSNDWRDIRVIHLAVEVISPSSAHEDRGVKRLLYQQRVGEYWIVDIEQRRVEVWTRGAANARIEREKLRWRHPAIADEYVLELARIFGE